ncbi:SNAP-25 [Trinorchestia longiramus]|nr:SNAP-25 [Trinorchestia longiramus]
MLGEQGEQLDRIEEGMDQINQDMKEAEKNLSGMEKCCGIFALPWKKMKEFRDDDSTWKDKGDGVVDGQPGRIIDSTNAVPSGAMQISRITNDAREDEMEENLGQVNTMVENLRNMAIDMGSEIDSQNTQISRLDAKASSNADRLKQANTRAETLLKNA